MNAAILYAIKKIAIEMIFIFFFFINVFFILLEGNFKNEATKIPEINTKRYIIELKIRFKIRES